jgi:hypothetical protein
MPAAQDVVRYPALTRLKTLAGARHELARLYLETKRGRHDPTLAGKLAHMLQVLINSVRDHEFDRRIEALERVMAERDAAAKPNGHDRRQAMRP